MQPVQDLFDSRVLVRRTAVEYAESLIADLSTLLKNRQTVLQLMNMTNINTASIQIIKDVIKCLDDTRQELRSLRVVVTPNCPTTYSMRRNIRFCARNGWVD